MRLEDYPVIVLVFHQEGCSSCEEFLPRLRAIAEEWAACVPTVLLDTSRYSLLANACNIRYTPTTLVARAGRISSSGAQRIEGAGEDEAIRRLFAACASGCDLEAA